MIDTKQRARHIFEEYAGCYSEVDIEELAKYLDEIKSEAIKEFAGKIADVFCSHDKGDTYVREVVYNLVKEMVGK